MSQEHDDMLWRRAGSRNGWIMPKRAPWLLRLPVIRTFRAAYYDWRVSRHNAAWQSVGLVPRGYDEWVIYAIARGWC